MKELNQQIQVPQLPKEKEAKPIIIAAEDLLILTVIVLVRSGDLDFVKRLVAQMEQVKEAMVAVERRESALVRELADLYVQINTAAAAATVARSPAGKQQQQEQKPSSAFPALTMDNYSTIASLEAKLTTFAVQLEHNSTQLEQRLDALTQLLMQFSSGSPAHDTGLIPATLQSVTSFQSALALTQDAHPGPVTLASQLQIVDDFIGENDRYTMAGYYLATTQAAIGLLLTHEPLDEPGSEEY